MIMMRTTPNMFVIMSITIEKDRLKIEGESTKTKKREMKEKKMIGKICQRAS